MLIVLKGLKNVLMLVYYMLLRVTSGEMGRHIKINIFKKFNALTVSLTDRPNVQDQALVEKLQHTYVEALHSYICIHRPNVSFLASLQK